MGKSQGDFFKFPRTPHLFDSEGTEDDKHLGMEASQGILEDEELVVEEKIDGTNTGIHFDHEGELLLQCRGHLITEGMHPQYDLFKSWTTSRRDELYSLLGEQFILFGEWMYAKHTVFYNCLPHYFLEFDIYDKENKIFLSTSVRQEMLEETSILSVPILHQGPLKKVSQLDKLITKSQFGEEPAEGLYLKSERDGVVKGRGKYVHPSFVTRLEQTGEHWSKGKMTPNELSPGVDIWS